MSQHDDAILRRLKPSINRNKQPFPPRYNNSPTSRSVVTFHEVTNAKGMFVEIDISNVKYFTIDK